MHKYNRGIFIGKFYPFHIGHLATFEKLINTCKKANLVFYYSQATEAKIAHQIGYEYPINQRISDVAKELDKHCNITIIKLEIPADISFPNDSKKIQSLVEKAIGGKADIQIFGEEEKDIYTPYAYADNFILGPIINVNTTDGQKTPLHASLIRHDYAFYRDYLPPTVRSSLDILNYSSLMSDFN